MTHRAPDRMLRIDLSEAIVASESVPEQWRRRYVEGKGLADRPVDT